MRWPWRLRTKLVEPRRASVSSKALELETAKEMIMKRLEERS